MRIPHLGEHRESTKFYPALRNALTQWNPDRDSPLELTLGDREGYAGDVVLEITPASDFASNWGGADASRFPARIRAAATALRDTGRFGIFRISHEDRRISIAALQDDAFSITLRDGTILGMVLGVLDKETFADRRELHDRKVHRGLVQGIAVAGSSVVLNGGYEDEDYGDVIIYTGEGGRDPNTGRQIADQELTRGNLALARNSDAGVPVRVIRGPEHRSVYAPKSGYRYDGLYRVDSYWAALGNAGFKIWQFRLERLAADIGKNRSDEILAPTTPERKESVVSRIIRNTAVGEEVKRIHDNTCQVCGSQVKTRIGTYSECCHIRPLGKPHNGPDVLENVLCLCPNCHVSFDRGAFTITDGLTISGRNTTLRTLSAHPVGDEHFAYHRALFQ